jgi:sterol desaturase/sphingolipid hydroxylase (fatty acid hydroxylase superfamily)
MGHYHKNNYGDIVWWDMLFGTYENPKIWDKTCGFENIREQQLLPMLAYQDVHAQLEKNEAIAPSSNG